jgi:hypothetical protein
LTWLDPRIPANGGEISHEGLTDLIAASRLLDAGLKAGKTRWTTPPVRHRHARA